MTYSIVARDAATGQLGVAVQTCMFAVGSVVPWARAGRRRGGEPGHLGARVRPALPGCDGRGRDRGDGARRRGGRRPDGRAAPGRRRGRGRLRGRDDRRAVHRPRRPPARRRLRRAGQHDALARGVAGDGRRLHRLRRDRSPSGCSPRWRPARRRGATPAGACRPALVVVEGVVPAAPGGGTVVDLRVDRSEDPIGDLTRLLVAADSYAGFGRAVDQLFGGDPAAALTTVDDALALLPGEENLRFLRSGALHRVRRHRRRRRRAPVTGGGAAGVGCHRAGLRRQGPGRAARRRGRRRRARLSRR